MAGGNKNKDIDNAPKKKKKKDGMVSRRPTGIHIRSDSTTSLPPRDTPIHCYSSYSQPYRLTTFIIIYFTTWDVDSLPSSFNPDEAVGIISQAIKDLCRDAFPTWGKMPSNLKTQFFLEFRKKCAWRPNHETKICANFHKKVARVLASLLMKACKNNKNPRWILSEDWEKLLAHLENDARFKQMSEIGKKARSSTKDGSLHTSGAQSCHIRKKKNPEDPDVWVEPRAEMTYFEGLSSSYDDEWMKKYLAMEQKIAELSSQVEDSRARERRRDLEYAGLKAQFDALLASGGIPPCSNDVTFPPRPTQSQPTRYPVYGQQRIMTDESSSDEEDEDHVANTLPH
ncbi:hypothetical protein KY289_030404 [Solanum tuberosum]|nr:hypothetical protein KY289_030404 [Solanum tuberosum]